MDILATLAAIWSWLWPVTQFIIGLGVVIFVHELGHFIAAKAVGIKVEIFAIGFGPRVVGIKRGETDYCLKLVPLGGYIKMLGQEDFAPTQDNPTQKVDPRSYQAKTVGQRMIVIAAGVVMNLVLAAVLFIVVFLVGKNFQAPVVGRVVPGYPAASAQVDWKDAHGAPANDLVETRGIAGGDRIVSMTGQTLVQRLISSDVDHLYDVVIRAALADKHEQFTLTLERQVDGQVLTGTTQLAVKDRGGRLDFGIDMPFSNRVMIANPPLSEGDVIVAVNGQRVEYGWQIDRIARDYRGGTVALSVQRGDAIVEIEHSPALYTDASVFCLVGGECVRTQNYERVDEKSLRLILADGSERIVALDEVLSGGQELLEILGMAPRLKVAAVEKGMPADKAGLLPGDIIISYGDVTTPTLRQFNEVNERLADDGGEVVVMRDGKTLDPVRIKPRMQKGRPLVGIGPADDLEHPVVGDVRQDSPAHAAGLAKGDVIRSVNGESINSWQDVYRALSELQAQAVSIEYTRGAINQTAEFAQLTDEMFDPAQFGWRVLPATTFLEPLQIKIVTRNPFKAVALGAGETWNVIMATYGTLRGLITTSLSHREVAGPIGMGSMAVKVARDSFLSFVYFMAFISASIAVLNFLPLPVVDGGHAVLLVVEKIRGKPLPVKVMNAITVAGLILILTVFLAVTWQDVSRLVRGGW